MKRLVLIVILALISSQTWAKGLADSYKNIKKEVVGIVSDNECKPEAPCPPCASDDFGEITRSDIDITVTFDVIDNPGDGRYDFYLLDNYHISANYNLTSGFYAYGSIGNKKYSRTVPSDGIYDEDWTAITLMAGVGIYVTPVISAHIGFGKVYPENDNGEKPAQDMAIEYGITYDIPWGKNKIVISWKMVESRLLDDDDDVDWTAAEMQGDASYSSFGIGLSIPFMR